MKPNTAILVSENGGILTFRYEHTMCSAIKQKFRETKSRSVKMYILGSKWKSHKKQLILWVKQSHFSRFDSHLKSGWQLDKYISVFKTLHFYRAISYWLIKKELPNFAEKVIKSRTNFRNVREWFNSFFQQGVLAKWSPVSFSSVIQMW